MKNTLLIELLTEELPPKSLEKLGMAFLEQVQKSLSDAGFIESSNAGRGFATPRRLAVQFEHCLAVQPDRRVEKKGPAVAAGVDATGKPTKALEGFCRSAGVVFEQLEKVQEGKNEYFVARLQKTGERLDAQLAALVENSLKKLPVAKVMRWGSGTAQFVRPVHGLVMLHGETLVLGEVLGLTSGRMTRGHRFMGVGEVSIPHADDYESVLEREGRVIAGFSRRRDMIRARLDAVAAGRVWLQDESLLNEVTALVEWPAVYEAGFESEFLAVPQECLILTMKANQKYFPLMEGRQLTNRFLVVSNMEVADPSNIIDGNARVVRPRLADARFFFETDKKTPLSARIGKLSRVVYHNKLGTQGDRVDRLVKLTAMIAGQLGVDVACAERAALLSKADLVTDMVGEFPELQGIMGRYYALSDGETAEVANAIETHYYPRFAGDALPQGRVACAVALADKLDPLTGFFGIGEKPTGDKDPFGLRRAALGILRILIETPLPLSLDLLIANNVANEEILVFLFDRLRGYLKDRGFPQNEIEAVVCQHPMRLDRLMNQMEAVHAFVHLPEAASLAAANKRVANILRKAEEAGESFDDLELVVCDDPAESSLREALRIVRQQAEDRFAVGDYAGYLAAFSVLKEPVDTFFSEVMVMVDDPAIRARRLTLLRELRTAMNRFADISKLS